MDKVGADPIKVLNELMQYDLLSTEFGGEVEVGRISAKSGEGLDELLEKVTHHPLYTLHICIHSIVCVL
jgi:translation initiation factor IF-2